MGVPVATARGKAVDLDSGHSISCLGGIKQYKRMVILRDFP